MSIQDKFKQTNHIYKITTDIDLKEQLLTIPENCTLDFQGGSFNNGTIKFNHTQLLNIQSFDDIGNNIIKDPSSTYHIGQLLYDPSYGNYKIWTGRGLAPITYNIIKEDVHLGIEELIIGDRYEYDRDSFVLNGFTNLKRIEIGNGCINKATKFVLRSIDFYNFYNDILSQIFYFCNSYTYQFEHKVHFYI